MGRKQIASFFGKLLKISFASLSLTGLMSCVAEPSALTTSETNLRNFALANCLGAYFQKHNWDDTDIRGVSGGYVEMGESSLETYMQIAEIVRYWRPEIATKHGLDVDLVKCFHLGENPSLNSLITSNLDGES